MESKGECRGIERNKIVHMAFLDLENGYDRVPREVVYWSLRKKEVPEYLVKVAEAMYEGARAKVRTDTAALSLSTSMLEYTKDQR